jgi:LacI family transcriptional regulator
MNRMTTSTATRTPQEHPPLHDKHPQPLRDRHAPTLRDVALRAGVSKTAVSVVMSGSHSTVRVSEPTRQRIMEAVRDLKFEPNVLARGLNGVRIKSIGISFQNLGSGNIITNYYSASILRGILEVTHDAGYNSNLFQRAWHGAAESAAGFRAQGIDGFLIVAPLAGSDMAAGLSALGIPLVVVSTSANVHNVPSVGVENTVGVRLVLDHLLSLGHRRIAHLFLGGEVPSFDSANRRETFLSVLAGAGHPVRPEYLRGVPYSYTDDTVAAVRGLMSLPEPPTALFTTNDSLARRAIEVVRDMGIRVPEQLSVVGFDDTPDAERTTPALTTVRQPLVEMGSKATRLLIALFEGREVAPETHWFAPELIVRSSTAQAIR